jgi:CheY-like chemotaxis protein
MRDAAEGAERVNRIVRHLRQMGRVENASHRVLDLPDVLDVALKMTAHATSHHAQIRRTFGVTPFVFASQSGLGQVFTNLLLNAAQAIGDGNADGNEIEVATYTDAAGRAVVEIRDSGPGLRADVLSHLFDPFFTTKTVGKGMGLGLAICNNLVTAMGGTVVASNRPNGGACFTVTLPPAKTTPAAATESHAVKGLSRRGNLLIVDDERAVAEAMSRGLRAQHDVTVETDGRKALARIAAGERFDVIFCDLMMPSFSGIDVHHDLSVSNPEQASRIVFISGGVFSERTAAFLESVENVQIEKPFVFETIRSIVRDFVKG